MHIWDSFRFIHQNIWSKTLFEWTFRLWKWLNVKRCELCEKRWTHTVERLCTHHVCRVFSCTEKVQLGLPEANPPWQPSESNWNESIRHMSRRSCLAAPAEAWAEILTADRLLCPPVSTGLIINCHLLHKACTRPAIVVWFNTKGQCSSVCCVMRGWGHSLIFCSKLYIHTLWTWA